MPLELAAALSKAESAKDAANLFTQKLPDVIERARVIFSLYGCTQDSWSIAAGMDQVLKRHFLEEIPAADVARLAAAEDLLAAAHAAALLLRLEDEKSSAAAEETLAAMPADLRDKVRAAAKTRN